MTSPEVVRIQTTIKSFKTKHMSWWECCHCVTRCAMNPTQGFVPRKLVFKFHRSIKTTAYFHRVATWHRSKDVLKTARDVAAKFKKGHLKAQTSAWAADLMFWCQRDFIKTSGHCQENVGQVWPGVIWSQLPLKATHSSTGNAGLFNW